MDRQKFRRTMGMVAAAALLGVSVTHASADTVLEWTFAADEHPTVARKGATNRAMLYDGTQVNTGEALGGNTDPRVRTGFLSVPNDGENAIGGMVMRNTGGDNNTWASIMPQKHRIGDDAFTVVYKPNWGGVPKETYRLIFASSADKTNANAIGLYFQQHAGGRLVMLADGKVNHAVAAMRYAPEPETWYLITGTWREDDTGLKPTDARIALYIRPLKPQGQLATAINARVDIETDDTGPMDEPICIGTGGFRPDHFGREAADGQFAYVRIDSKFMTESQFNQLYASLLSGE